RRGPAGAQLAGACRDVAAGAAPRSPHWLAAWHGLARSAWTDEQADALSELLAGTGVPQALRWDALTRLVSLGRAGEQHIAAESAVDPDPDAGQSAAVARAAADTPEAKRAALDALLAPDGMPIGALPRLAGGLWQPHQHDLLTGVMGDFLDRLPQAILDGGPARAMRLTRWCFPSFGLGPEQIERVRRLAADPALLEVARTALADQAVLAERRARAATLPG
ncbi:MAG TPA: ERAP1-like C-terminal domain-containing protein, partial [Nakamurella sp.]|nr:ERAP1-like C-terminal domain-containing protein [Nakamurella sp.]